MRILETPEKDKAFQNCIENGQVVEAVSALVREYVDEKKTLAEKLVGAEWLKVQKKEVKTIGMYYHRMTPGGVQRVISLLIPLYLEWGYKVVLLTDEEHLGEEYVVPEQVERIVLPSALLLTYDEYPKRAELLKEALVNNRIDVMLYHAAESRFLLYDLILTKSLGIPFCIAVHGLFSAEMLRQNYHIIEKKSTFKLADRLIVLSEMEKAFWIALGIDTVFIPNPVQELPFSEKEGEYILWLGRLEEVCKQPAHAVEIMKRVTEVYPETTMKMVGTEVSKGIIKKLRKKIKKAGLNKNIAICEGTTDVGHYYENAKVFLCTSAVEAFSMTLVESKAYGIPLVTYDMPYLEVLKQSKGFISVPQDDVSAGARAIIELLEKDELRKRLKEEARESYEMLRQYDLRSAWEELLSDLFENVGKQKKIGQENAQLSLAIHTMLEHYGKGCIKNGAGAEHKPIRILWRFGRVYRFWKENGFRQTRKMILRKIGDTHD